MSKSADSFTAATQALDAKHINYRSFTHPGQVESLEQAARERGQKPEQVIRSILFRLPGNSYVLVLVAGPTQISWTKLRNYLNTNRITMASSEEVLKVTGFPIGAVSPFGLSSRVRILIDQSVLTPEQISIGSGVRNTTIIMNSADIQKALPDNVIGIFTD